MSFTQITLTATQAQTLYDLLNSLKDAVEFHQNEDGDVSRKEWGEGDNAVNDIAVYDDLNDQIDLIYSLNHNDYPLADEVRIASRLKPEQVYRDWKESDLDADVASRVVEQTVMIEQRLSIKAAPYTFPSTSTAMERAYPNDSETQIDEKLARQTSNLRLAIKLSALASLYRSIPNIEVFQKQAEHYEERSEAVIKVIEAELEYIAMNQENTTGERGAATLHFGSGDYTTTDEDDFPVY